jgi:hypothetical protein
MNSDTTTNSGYRSENASAFLHNLETDREYLLRCALTHDWEPVVHFCNFMEEYAGANPYSTSRRLCSSQLLACDQYGNSVLQACCYYRPPVLAIRAILRASQKLSCHGDLLHHRSLDQSTALQVACATGSSVVVIEALLGTTTTPTASNRNNKNPLNPASTSSTSTTCSSQGNRILHPGMLVFAYDQQGATPLSDLVVQYTLERKGPLHVTHSKALEDINDVETERITSPIFDQFWSKVELLVNAAWAALSFTSTLQLSCCSSVLCRAAAMAGTCPALLTDLLVRCLTIPSTSACTNGGTTLPLHCILDNVVTRVVTPPDCPLVNRQQLEYFTDCLLQRDPIASGIPFGIPTKRSPLTYVLMQGFHWHALHEDGVGRIILRSKRAELDMVGPVQRICIQSPASVGQRDALSGLYPWQLAALWTSHSKHQNSASLRYTDLRQLETIYHLLRQFPQSIRES